MYYTCNIHTPANPGYRLVSIKKSSFTSSNQDFWVKFE